MHIVNIEGAIGCVANSELGAQLYTQKIQLANPVAYLLNYLRSQFRTHLTTCAPKITKERTYLHSKKKFRYLRTKKARKARATLDWQCFSDESNLRIMQRSIPAPAIHVIAQWRGLALWHGLSNDNVYTCRAGHFGIF